MHRQARQGGLTLITALFVALAGCQSNEPRGSTSVAGNPAGPARDADDLLIIDCVLPSQIRKLGQNVTYLAPRRAIKTSAVDCEIRGGEYVAYDRADYATALKIWLPMAQEGDAEAQAYVGEIYEKGLGITPDYATALAWYRKAAAQGNTRAKINLGFLYESGLGVDRDLTTAMNWYREASGLTEGNLEFVSSVELAKRHAAAAELRDLRAETKQLRRQLQAAQEQLSTKRRSLAETRRRAEQLRDEIARVQRPAAPPTPSAPPRDAAAEAKLRKDLEVAQSERRRLLEDLAQRDAEVAEYRRRLDETQSRLEAKRADLRRTEQALEATRRQLTGLRSDKNAAEATQTRELQREIEDTTRRVRTQRTEIARLTRALSDAQLNNQDLSSRLQARSEKISELQNRLAEELASDESLAEVRMQLETSQEDRVRLMNRLAEVQLEAASIQEQLQQTRNALQLREQQAEQSATALARLQDVLADVRANSDASDDAVAELRAAIAQRESALANNRNQIATLKQQLRDQSQAAQQSQASAERREAALLAEVDDQERRIDSLNEKLAAALRSNDRLSSTQEQLADADRERSRLAKRLASQSVELARLREELDAGRTAIAVQEQQVKDNEDTLALLQAQLASSENALQAETGRAEALETRLAEQSARLESQRAEVKALEEKALQDRARLEVQLAEALEKQRSLQSAAQEHKTTIASLEKQLVSTKESLASSERKIEELERVEAQLQEETQKASKLEHEVDQLRRQISTREKPIEGPKITKVMVTEETGPVIEIIEPPLAATRSVPSVLLRSPTRAVELIGRVKPEDQLLSFKINEKPGLLEDNGLFRKLIAVRTPNTPVNIVAVDNNGQRTALDFVIVPQAKRPASSGDARTRQPKATPVSKPAVDFGRYHALVIGNQTYQHMPNLKTPENDARELERILRTKYGFTTHLLVDASRYQILSALNDLRATLTEKDNLLVFYAGHGELDNVNLRGHWLPVDAEPGNSANWISNVAITDVLNVMAAKHILVIADSCYSGAMTRSSLARLETGMPPAAKTKWYRIMSKARARAVLTSGGLQPVLDSGGGDHSIFTAALLQVLRSNRNVLEGYKLYRNVQERVKKQAARLNVDQDPQYAPIKFAGHEAGEFFFVPQQNVSFGALPTTAASLARVAGL